MQPRLVRPTLDRLPRYVAALQRGWSPDNVRGPAAAADELALIQANAQAFVDSLHDPLARGPAITLPDGTVVPRLPGFRRWMWHDDDFVGSINLRWQTGSAELPPHVLGHAGYAVVPWAAGRGHATEALRQLADLARGVGLPWLELTTDEDNLASQRVIAKAGGVRVEAFRKPAAYGGHTGLRYRIPLRPRPDGPWQVLVAGPYRSGTGDDPVLIERNVHAMTDTALQLFRAGHLPVLGEWVALPLIRQAGSTRVGDAAFDNIFHPVARRLVARCDACLRIGGPSAGADEMVALARAAGASVFFHLDDVPGPVPRPAPAP